MVHIGALMQFLGTNVVRVVSEQTLMYKEDKV